MKYKPGPYGSVILPKKDDLISFQLAQLFADAEREYERALEAERFRRATQAAEAYWGTITKRLPKNPNWPSASGISIREAKLLNAKKQARAAKR